MSALPQAVKFRELADQLDDSEFTRFLSTLCAQFGRDIFLTPLFNQFQRENNHNVTRATAAIHDILNSRREKSNSPSVAPLVSLQSLPGELVGEIGSYCSQIDYFDFSQSCRSIYVGCNTPNTLRALDLRNIGSDQHLASIRYFVFHNGHLTNIFC